MGVVYLAERVEGGLEQRVAARTADHFDDAAPRRVSMSWRSRVERLMRGDDEAAGQAARLLRNQTTRRDRLFIEAVVAEARRHLQTAQARHRELVAAFPDEPAWVIELAEFQDRLATADGAAQAIGNCIGALRLDPAFLAPISNSVVSTSLRGRTNEFAPATHGQRSLDASWVSGDRNAEARPHVPTYVLSVGSDANRRESQRNVEMAQRIRLGIDAKTHDVLSTSDRVKSDNSPTLRER